MGMALAAANVSEQALLVPALDDVPVEVPEGTPVVADKGHDSDPLRDDVEAAGFVPVIPHRNNRVKPPLEPSPRAVPWRRPRPPASCPCQPWFSRPRRPPFSPDEGGVGEQLRQVELAPFAELLDKHPLQVLQDLVPGPTPRAAASRCSPTAGRWACPATGPRSGEATGCPPGTRGRSPAAGRPWGTVGAPAGAVQSGPTACQSTSARSSVPWPAPFADHFRAPRHLRQDRF